MATGTEGSARGTDSPQTRWSEVLARPRRGYVRWAPGCMRWRSGRGLHWAKLSVSAIDQEDGGQCVLEGDNGGPSPEGVLT